MIAGRGRAALLLALAALPLAGCGDNEPAAPPSPAAERADRPAQAPRGWSTLLNRRAGFSVAVPPGWSTRKRPTTTLIRSGDGLLALSIQADRSRAGRDAPARAYARQALLELPGFRGLAPRARGRVAGSPYETARFDATGTLERARGRQRVSVAAFRRPGRVTYSVFAFRNARRAGRRHERALDGLLATLRGRPPRIEP